MKKMREQQHAKETCLVTSENFKKKNSRKKIPPQKINPINSLKSRLIFTSANATPARTQARTRADGRRALVGAHDDRVR